MKKEQRIAAFVQSLANDEVAANHEVFANDERGAAARDPHYIGFFRCFNAQQYYEAHDVLEQLWLKCHDAHRLFYQALIQVSGAFVHLQKQFLHPAHPKHATRLRPATRLFHLAARNLERYRPQHLELNVEAVCQLCEKLAAQIIDSQFRENPWHPLRAPKLDLERLCE